MKRTEKNNRTWLIPVPDDIYETDGCVFKLHYDGKYIVVMGKTLIRQIESIENDISRFTTKNKKSLYYRFCKHVKENPGKEFTIEIVLVSDNPYQLLKTTQSLLDIGVKEKRKCCNKHSKPFISKSIQAPRNSAKTPHWISRGHYLNFRSWQKKRHLDIK
jgi:hypothetical protein